MPVRDVSYESILRGIASKGGIFRDILLTEQSSILYDLINDRFKEFCEHAYWTELLIVETRYFREGLWSAGTYAANDIVYDSTTTTYYINSSGTTTTETPSATATDWTDPGDFDRYVAFEQTGGSNTTASTKIGFVKDIYAKDPRVAQTTGSIGKRMSNNGVGPVDDTTDILYIEFSELVRDTSGMVEWDATDTYAIGEWVYYQGSTTQLFGEAYEVIVATTAGQDPQDTAASFSKLVIPKISAEFLKRGALADWLAAGGGGSALGDAPSTISLTAFNESRAMKALETAAFNEWGNQTTYTSYKMRTS